MEYLHDFPADGGFQCAIVIWQIRQLDLLGLNGSTGITVESGTAIVVEKPRAAIPWKPLEDRRRVRASILGGRIN